MAAYNLTNADIIKGGHLMVFVGDTPIAFATSHQLSKTMNTQEISTKDHGDFSAVLPQNITWEITTENLYSLNGYQLLNDAFNTMQPVTVYFGETSYDQSSVQGSIVGVGGAENWTKTGFGESGQAYITSLQVTAGAGENATFSATFTGNGSLTTSSGTYNLTLTGSGAQYVNLSTYAALPDAVITVTPDSPHDNTDIRVETVPVTEVTWNTSYWAFTMPANNVKVTCTYTYVGA